LAKRSDFAALILAFTLWTPLAAHPQSPQQELSAIPATIAFPLKSQQDTLSITTRATPSQPFSVIGPRGAVLGSQNGSYEMWLFPWKVLSDLHISAEVKDYPVPIDVNQLASSIEVRPYATTITFSHANFTVREIVFAPREPADGSGAGVFFQIESVRPVKLTFSFTPIMQRMWPAESDDRPSPEWVKTAGGSGFYILHMNFPDNAAAVAMPTAQPGILEPYQELAHNYPMQFVLSFDPAHDANKYFPMLVTMGHTPQQSNKQALAASLAALAQSLSATFEKNHRYFQNLTASHMSIHTPDEKLNDAFSWAEVSIDQLRVQTTPDHDEEALTAGFVGSGDAARPGFGWFFGRDALWSLYAVNSYGDFDVTRKEIEFLLHRQSPEGKIMHEWSQTANLVDWKSLPYEYASADATSLLPMVMNDYMHISGDKDFIASHWDALMRAWNFECSHDTDGDGIYDNSEGSGWVESWIPTMPHQEIYLTVLDEQASIAFAYLAHATGHEDLAKTATVRATHIRSQIEKEYYRADSGFYSFSWEGNGKTDNTATIFPAVAWWDGSYSLEHDPAMMARWASAEFSTDWGTRILSDQTSFYDPISYHQGTVWPLFTGWVSLAEYRGGHSLSGWAHLKQNANLTWAQDQGNATELLSGQFFQPLGRSTAHQLWSSAMIISPVVRGLFGIEWNAQDHEISVTPSLPAQWNDARLANVPLGDQRVDLAITRDNNQLIVRASGAGASGLHLKSRASEAKTSGNEISIPLPPVEAGIDESLPTPGSATAQMKVLDQKTTPRSLTLRLSAPAGTKQAFYLRINDPKLRGKTVALHSDGVSTPDQGAALQKLEVTFGDGGQPGAYVEKEVKFSW
jgi:glycogen debranching enzyme